MYTRRKEIEAVIADLLQISEPQKGKFIGAYNLCKDYKYWKEETIVAFRHNCSYAKTEIFKKCIQSLNTFFKDFEEQVKGEIVEEGNFFTDKEIENEQFESVDDKFTMESVYPISLLKNTVIDIPEGFTHFMILPVDYNRGTQDIGIAFMTRKGKHNYSQYLTGDY